MTNTLILLYFFNPNTLCLFFDVDQKIKVIYNNEL